MIESVIGNDEGDERGAARTKKITAAPMEMRREETNEMTTYTEREKGGPADNQREVRQQEGKRRGDGEYDQQGGLVCHFGFFQQRHW